MPSKLFQITRARIETNKLARTLRGSFSAQPDVKMAAVMGNRLVAVGGTLYNSTVDGSEVGKSIAVVNIGSPANAIYAPAAGGVATFAQSSGGGGTTTTVGGAGDFSSLSGTISDIQAPQFLKVDGSRPLAGSMAFVDLVTIDNMDPSVHVVDPNAHHNRLHDIFSASDHSQTGAAALDVFGFNGSAMAWLTPSSNPGVATKILKSDSAGALALQTLSTPLINTLSGNLTLDPVGDVLFPNAQIARTTTFSSSFPIGGWELYPTAISGQSGLTIGVIEADELRVRIFVANETRVDRGEKYDSKSFGITSEDFTTPGSIGGTVRIYFEDSPAITGAIFSTNDWLLFRSIDIGSGLVVANVWGQVDTYVNETGAFQSWNFTLRQGATGYLVKKSSFAVDWGASGQGLIHYSAVDPTGAPYIEFLTWAGSNPYTPANYTTHVRVGKLVTSLNNNLLPTGYGLYGDNAFLAGDFLTGNGMIRMYQATGINIQEAVSGTYYPERSVQWWPDVSIVSGSATLTIFASRDVTTSENLAYYIAYPTGGVGASVLIQATHQGSGTEALLSLDGGSSALSRPSWAQIFADKTSIHGPLATDLITTDGLRTSLANTPNDIGTNAQRFDNIYADNIVANTLTAAVTSGATLSGNIWQNDASNMTIESSSATDRIVYVTNPGTGKMTLNVDNDIVVGGLVDGVDVSVFYTAYGTHSHSHSALSNLSLDDHVNYMHIATNRTVTAQHSFSPASARAPFLLGANAQGQLVTGLRADQVNRQIIAGSGLSGTGTLTSDVTLTLLWGTPTIGTIIPDAAANAGTAATPARSDHTHAIVAAAPASNLTVATTNFEGASTSFSRSDHIHAITNSNNPGAAASLLSSTGAGGLTLQTMVLAGTGLVLSSSAGTLSLADNVDSVHKLGRTAIGHASYSNFAAFSHRSLTAAGQYGVLHESSGALYLNATTGNIIYHRVNNVDTMQMTSQRLNPAGSGLIDIGDYNRKWRTLFATELYVEVLVAQSVMATIGGRILVAPTTKLLADVNDHQETIDVKDNNLFNGDFLRLETAPGGLPQVESMKVVSTPTAITGGWRYSVRRKVDSTAAAQLIANTTSVQTTMDFNNSMGINTYLYLSAPSSGPAEMIKLASSASTISGGYRYTVTRNVNGLGASGWLMGTQAFWTYRAWVTGDAVVSLAGGGGVKATLIAALATTQITIDVNTAMNVGSFYFLENNTQYEAILCMNTGTAITGGFRHLIARNVQANPGNQIIANMVSTSQTTMDVSQNGLVVNDYACLFGALSAEMVKVTAGPGTITGGYRYTITRGISGAGVAWGIGAGVIKSTQAWVSGSTLHDEAARTGRGYIDLTSTSTIHNHLGPTIAIYSRTGTANWNDVAAVVSMGNLRSFVDYTADTFGWAVGNNLTLSPTGGFSGMTGDAAKGLRLFNVSLDMYAGGAQFLDIAAATGIEIYTTNTTQLDQHAYTFAASPGGAAWGGLYAWDETATTGLLHMELSITAPTAAPFLSIHSYTSDGTKQANAQLYAESGLLSATVACIAKSSTSLSQVAINGDILHSLGKFTSGAQVAKFGSIGGGELYLTTNYSSYPDTTAVGAEISNDTSSFNALLLVGNKGGGGGIRRVAVYDQLQVGGAAYNLGLNVVGGVFLANLATPGTPSGGGYLYANAGKLMYKGSSGTVTTLAVA